jgi:hypothetical protein
MIGDVVVGAATVEVEVAVGAVGDVGGEPPPLRLFRARAIRLPDDVLLVFLALLPVFSEAPAASSPESPLDDSEPLLLCLVSPGTGEAVRRAEPEVGDVRKDCRPSASSMRRKAVTAVQPE